ncbi:MAG: autotransporter assembly complex protein TamA [Rubrimonas sp.]
MFSPGRRARQAAAAAVLAAALAGCAGNGLGDFADFEPPATELDYTVELQGAPNDEIDALLRESLGVFRRQDEGAQSVAFLRRRAQQDVETAQRILRSFGYFRSELRYQVTPPEVEGGPAQVALTLDPGPPFILERHGFVYLDDGGVPPRAPEPAALGSPVGRAAAATPILNAESAAVTLLRNAGRPYAAARGRDAVADMDAATLEIDSFIAAGGPYVFGPPQFEGLRRVRPEYLLTYRNWTEGEPFNAARLAEFQRELAETRLFSVVTALPPKEPPEGEVAPVVISVEEAPRRTVSAGARFNTATGPAVRGSFEHRNLFGSNEQIRLDAVAGLEEQTFDALYREPQFLRPGQDFVSGLNLRHIEDDAFDETAATLTAGIERRLSRWWRVGGGGLLEATETTDSRGTRRFALAGLPVFAAYDVTDDLLNPTRGLRFRADATPFAGQSEDGDTPLFTRVDTTGSVYQALDSDGLYVLAGRARGGFILAGDEGAIPASRRFYSGGGGSVRGYADRSIGPLDDRGNPEGGLSVIEVGAELRAQVADPFGVALFVEGGAVSEDPWPSFSDGAQFAAGLGLRYMSPVGPIRLDVGVPLNARREDDAFQFYISIGQAY